MIRQKGRRHKEHRLYEKDRNTRKNKPVEAFTRRTPKKYLLSVEVVVLEKDYIERDVDVIRVERVFEDFRFRNPDVSVTEIEFELDDDFGLVYEITGCDDKNEYEETIDALKGDFIKIEYEESEGVKGSLDIEDIRNAVDLLNGLTEEMNPDSKFIEWKIKDKKGKKTLKVEIIDENNKKIEYKYNIEKKEEID